MAEDPIALLEATLAWARHRDYAGYDYADGMSSRIRELLPFEHPYLNLAFQESAKRAPVNVRPLLRIPRRRSFKGSGLFVSANLAAHALTGDPRYHVEAVRLGRWLLAHRRDSPFGWGHNHHLQTRSGTVSRNTPSIVTVTYVTRALIELEATGMEVPFDVPTEIEGFVRGPLGFEQISEGGRIDYRAQSSAPYTVLNANALAGALLAEVSMAYETPALRDPAEALLRYVAARQHASGGWMYADPPAASHLSMDNHHNGFILESYLRYRRATGDDTFDDTIRRAAAFHRDVLYEPDGAPNWDETRAYPRDIHAAAQGIITFTHLDDHAFARQVLAWTLQSLYAGDGRFRYRQGRLLTRRFTLMRWCQAWMALAVATLAAAEDNRPIPNVPPRRVA